MHARVSPVQEWYAEDETIVDRGAGLCLCPDTRNSPSTTNSLSPSPTPSTSHAPLPQQRITTCDCDGSASQAWDYAPAEGSIGPVVNRLTSQCWALVTDDCAVARDDDGGYTACVELQVRFPCGSVWGSFIVFGVGSLMFCPRHCGGRILRPALRLGRPTSTSHAALQPGRWSLRSLATHRLMRLAYVWTITRTSANLSSTSATSEGRAWGSLVTARVSPILSLCAQLREPAAGVDREPHHGGPR